jgi:hypothetical protein
MARGGMEDALSRAWGPSFSTGRSVIQGTLEALRSQAGSVAVQGAQPTWAGS